MEYTNTVQDKETSIRHRYYHYIILITCCLLAASAIGICLNAAGVFYSPVAQELGVGRGAVALHATLSNLVLGLSSPLAAKAFRRFNAKGLIAFGVILASLSTLFMAFSNHIFLFYLLGITRGIGCSLFSMLAITTIVGNWYKKKQGLAIGLVFCFSGLGGAVFNALFSNAITQYGWRSTYILAAALIFILGFPAALIIIYDPAKIGRPAYGEAQERKQKPAIRPVSLKSILFVLVSVIAILIPFTSGIGQHFPGYGETIGKGLSFGASMVSAAMIGNIVFKLVLGLLSDRYGAINACTVLLAINITALFMLHIDNPNYSQGYYLAAAFLYGTVYAIGAVGTSLITRFVFGSEKYPFIYGFVSMSVSIGSALSLTIIGYIYDLSSSYQPAVLLCLCFAVTVLIILQVLRYRQKMQKHIDKSCIFR